jgi:hypothetical protein
LRIKDHAGDGNVFSAGRAGMIQDTDDGNFVGELVFVKWLGADEFARMAGRKRIGSGVESGEWESWRRVGKSFDRRIGGILSEGGRDHKKKDGRKKY